MIGKEKCRMLKEIRQRIADENGIPYKTHECSHKGPCSGTCPFCESEVRYLEDRLKTQSSLGRPVKIAALCTGMVLAASGCAVIDSFFEKTPTPTPEPEIEWLTGEVGPAEYYQDPLPQVTEEAQPIEFDLTGYVAPEGY